MIAGRSRATLPARPTPAAQPTPAAPAAQPTAAAPAAAPSMSILLLGEEQPGAFAPSRVLGTRNYRTHVARQPGDAHRLLAEHEDIGIAILHLHGDGFRGIEVYAALCQRLSRDRELAAIFLARSPSVNDAVRALRLGAVDLLRSPVDPDHLLDAVARAETLVHRRSVLRTGAAAMTGLLEEMQRTAAAQLEAARRLDTLGPSLAATEFTEQLDATAQREDTASLASTQRLRRRLAEEIRAQTTRRQLVSPALLGDPCWEMLLDLLDKSMAGRTVSVSSLCSVVAVPATTALRRLDDMVAAGLIRRTRDDKDARRVLVCLTEDGTNRLRAYFDAAGARAASDRAPPHKST